MSDFKRSHGHWWESTSKIHAPETTSRGILQTLESFSSGHNFSSVCRFSNKTREKFHYTHCNGTNHTIDKCYRLHGFPPKNHKKNDKFGANIRTLPETLNFTPEQYQQLLTLFCDGKSEPKVNIVGLFLQIVFLLTSLQINLLIGSLIVVQWIILLPQVVSCIRLLFLNTPSLIYLMEVNHKYRLLVQKKLGQKPLLKKFFMLPLSMLIYCRLAKSLEP